MDLVKKMLSIKGRYGKKPSHHGDCNIYRADLPHCSCGLIHDLLPLNNPKSLYKKFDDDLYVSETGKLYIDTERSINLELLREFMPEMANAMENVICIDSVDEKEAREHVFGDSGESDGR